MDGWVKIYRKMTEWEWYKDTNTKVVMLHLILTANHADNKYAGMIIRRGQVLTSYAKLADELGLSVKEIRTAISHLKKTGELGIARAGQGAGHGQLITLANYGLYQLGDNERAKQVSEMGQSKGKARASNKNDKNDKNKDILKKESKEKSSLSLLRQNHEAFQSIKQSLMRGGAET